MEIFTTSASNELKNMVFFSEADCYSVFTLCTILTQRIHSIKDFYYILWLICTFSENGFP